MNITLKPMTTELAHLFYKNFSYDRATFSGAFPDKPYVYFPEKVDGYCSKQLKLKRIHLAVLQDQRPVGEILFKCIDQKNRSCVYSIHLQNDAVKNRGIGTEAGRKALVYAFKILNMKIVFADVLIQNKRSRHVLEKLGYQEIKRDELFCYYRYDISRIIVLMIIAQFRSKRNKIFILLRSLCPDKPSLPRKIKSHGIRQASD